MKMIFFFLSMLLNVSCAGGKDKTYTGSTPADTVIRSFLGISHADSVDFIRWRFMLRDNRYQLQCTYGVARANTNGFINGGATIRLSGEYKKDKNYFYFQQGTRTLKAVELNADLIHLLNSDNSLLVGNGGWSYTLNHVTPSGTDQVSITAPQTLLKDSMAFEGRTPCGVPGVIADGSRCYKLKWLILLYTDSQTNKPGGYKLLGTAWRKEGGRTGTWKIIAGKNGRTIYQLNNEKGTGFLYLLKLDERILVFVDAQGKILVGDEDFSYTLNRRW